MARTYKTFHLIPASLFIRLMMMLVVVLSVLIVQVGQRRLTNEDSYSRVFIAAGIRSFCIHPLNVQKVFSGCFASPHLVLRRMEVSFSPPGLREIVPGVTLGCVYSQTNRSAGGRATSRGCSGCDSGLQILQVRVDQLGGERQVGVNRAYFSLSSVTRFLVA